MTIFEMMLDRSFREQFVNRKKEMLKISLKELEDICNYVMSDECEIHIRQLMQGDYFFEIPQKIRIRKALSERRREVYRFQVKETILMKLMAYALHKYDGIYTDSLYSYALDRKLYDAFRKISSLKKREDVYLFKTDIHDFSANIDEDILLLQLKKLFGDEDEALYLFLEWLLKRGMYTMGDECFQGRLGALSGCPLTSFFDNVYLLAIDDLMREKSQLYIRYCDDIAVFTSSEEKAKQCQRMFTEQIESLHLRLNEEKTYIFGPKDPFDLLGFKIDGDHYDLADFSVGKIKRKMTRRTDKLLKRIQQKRITKETAMKQMIRYVDRYFFGRLVEEQEFSWAAWSFPILTRHKSLEELDHFAQNCIRIVGSGKRTDAKYRITYEMMKCHGYRSLVNAYHHGYELMEESYEYTNCDPKSLR